MTRPGLNSEFFLAFGFILLVNHRMLQQEGILGINSFNPTVLHRKKLFVCGHTASKCWWQDINTDLPPPAVQLYVVLELFF